MGQRGGGHAVRGLGATRLARQWRRRRRGVHGEVGRVAVLVRGRRRRRGKLGAEGNNTVKIVVDYVKMHRIRLKG